MTNVVQAPVVESVCYTGLHHLLAIRSREIALNSKPGQFVMVSPANRGSDPLLKRALAIYSLPPEKDNGKIITLLIKVVGEGTRQLASLVKGDETTLIGPLGNGFDTSLASGKTSLIVAGGVGIASVYLLAEKLSKSGEDVRLLYGAQRAEDLVGLQDFQNLEIPIQITTEDGSKGLKGRVTQALTPYFARHSPKELTVYTCGPNPMMKAVSKLTATHRVNCQISVETHMACGFGVCLGCSVKTVHSFRLACSDGPVFDAQEFVWE